MDYFIVTVKVLLVIALGIGLHYFLQAVIRRLHRRQLLPHSLYRPVMGIVKWLLLIFILILALQQMGISISRVVGALSAVLVLVAVGFVAFWSILTNILSAFFLIMFQPFRIGDIIELREPDKEKGTSGKVVDLNIFYTTMEEITDDEEEKALIRVPNSLFFQRIIICHAGKNTRSLKQAINEPETDSRA